jgi:hypothetical protein
MLSRALDAPLTSAALASAFNALVKTSNDGAILALILWERFSTLCCG